MRHNRSRHRRNSCEQPGTIRRVTQALADRFGLERRWVLIGFIAGLVINAPLSIGLFLLAWFWTDNPKSLETFWANLKDPFLHMKPRPSHSARGYSSQSDYQETTRQTAETPFEADPFMDDLKRKFDDLEERAGKMESQVTSDDYELRQKFKRMEDEG